MRHLILVAFFMALTACGQAPKDGDSNPYVLKDLGPEVHQINDTRICNLAKAETNKTYGKPLDVVIYSDYASAFVYEGFEVVFTPLSNDTCNIQKI